MITIKANPGELLCIGRYGEDNHRRVAFDISKWLKSYGSHGTVAVTYRRPGDAVPYNCDYVRDKDTVYWTATAVETKVPPTERGWIGISYIVGDTIAASERWRTCVSESMLDGLALNT